MNQRLHLLPVLLLALAFPAFGQDQEYVCPFDEEKFDTVQIIDPQPRDPETMLGGIPDTACINTPYEFTFAISIPDTNVNFAGQSVPILLLDIDPEEALSFDPPLADFNYVCDPPSCQFEQGTNGCVKIFGTATEEELGDHELQIEAVINIGLPISVTFPDPDLYPGNYTVNVQDESFENCLLASVPSLADEVSIRNYPNPFTDHTRIVIDAREAKRYELRVVDMLGKIHYTQVLDAMQGPNTIDFDGSGLTAGMYFFHLTDGQGVLTKKMIHR